MQHLLRAAACAVAVAAIVFVAAGFARALLLVRGPLALDRVERDLDRNDGLERLVVGGGGRRP